MTKDHLTRGMFLFSLRLFRSGLDSSTYISDTGYSCLHPHKFKITELNPNFQVIRI